MSLLSRLTRGGVSGGGGKTCCPGWFDRESGPLSAVHLSRHKWPGGLVNSGRGIRAEGALKSIPWQEVPNGTLLPEPQTVTRNVSCFQEVEDDEEIKKKLGKDGELLYSSNGGQEEDTDPDAPPPEGAPKKRGRKAKVVQA